MKKSLLMTALRTIARSVKRAISKLPADDTDHLNATQANRDHLDRSVSQARAGETTQRPLSE